MKLLTVWHNRIGVNEKCLTTESGDYVAIDTGKLYKKEDGHTHSKQHIGIIRRFEEIDQTGMVHLDQGSDGLTTKQNLIKNLIGCFVTLESAHSYGDVKVYRCSETKGYVTSNEVEIITKQELRRLKIEQILDDR